MNNVDVFICYRRHSAQTAKLFKKYLKQHRFGGEVWYSDSEIYGNYKTDIPSLIFNAKCAIVLIDPDFTYNFLGDKDSLECITAIEIVEIIKKKLQDDSFRIITVYVDRINALSEGESEIICKLLLDSGVNDPEEAVKLVSQSNAVFFSTARDDEEELFSSISRRMLPNDYYAMYTPNGNFYFGVIQTYADIILWDSDKSIEIENIYFENTPMEIPLYKKIERRRSNLTFETQNNTMVSLIGTDTILNDETEEKILSIRYQRIDYHLFFKTLTMWNQFELNKEIAVFDWHSDIYQIPNAMGLAFMVITSDNQMIFTRRSEKRRVRPAEYDCSIVEGLKFSGTQPNGNPYDINSNNYLDCEIRRAFREEVCNSDDNLEIRIYGLVLDKAYGQWNLVGTIKTPLTSEDIIRLHFLRDDTYEDNQMEYIPFTDKSGTLSLSQVKRRLRFFLGERIWGMALTAVYAALICVGFTNRQISDMTESL